MFPVKAGFEGITLTGDITWLPATERNLPTTGSTGNCRSDSQTLCREVDPIEKYRENDSGLPSFFA